MLAGLFQNGIAIGKPMRTRLLGKRIHWNAFYRLTNIVGEDVFLANQQAAGLRYETGGHAAGMTLEVGWAGGAAYDSLRVRFLGRF